jgi:hypothetical protein
LPQTASSQTDLKAAALAGIIAGTAATLFEILLWCIHGVALPETLLRDARLAAAIVLGREVLPPPSTFDGRVMLAATIVHFGISIASTVVLSVLIARLAFRAAIVAGALFGLALYAIDMYGFTVVFPWFAITRDGITAFTHVAFGMIAAASYKLLAAALRSAGP